MNPFRAARRFYHARSAWLGDGGHPVSTLQATARSSTCLRCPRHDSTSPIWEGLAYAATLELRLQIELRNQMKLTLPEPRPHLCGVCGCLLELKVYEPLSHARATTELAELPKNCWMLTEAAESPAPSVP